MTRNFERMHHVCARRRCTSGTLRIADWIPLIDKACRDRDYALVMIRTPRQPRRLNVQDEERDPIMAELREIRARMAVEAGGNDPRKIMAYVRSKRKSPTTDSRGHPLVLRRKNASKSDDHSKE